MARSIHRLTARKAQTAKGPVLLSDGGGLYLQVTEAGNRSWIFRYTGLKYERDGSPKLNPDGTHKRGLKDHGLGSLRDVSLASARVLAGDCRDVVKAGGDPVEDKRAKRQQAAIEAAKVLTFKECAERCIDGRSEGWKNDKTPAQWRASLETYAYPVIGALPVQSVDVNHVMQILELIWYKKPETASRVRGRIENILDCPSSKHLGRLSLYSNRGSGSSWFDVKPLGVDGSSGGSGWSAS